MTTLRKAPSFVVALGVAALAIAALSVEGCNGFGTTCSTDADCQAQNPGSICDSTYKVCFLYPGATFPPGPYVKSIAPANQSTGVPAANGQVVATFSEVIADAGVNANTFVVSGQGFKPPGHYLVTVDSADASVATFKSLAGGLALGTDYTVSLTSGIKDLSGATLLPFDSTFTTKDGVFGGGNLIRPPASSETGQYAVASNYFGNVITAVSYFLPGTTDDFGIFGGVSVAGGTPTVDENNPLQAQPGLQVNYPSVGIASDGTAFAAWSNLVTAGPDAGRWDVQVALWDSSVQAWRYVQQLDPVPPQTSPQAAPTYPQVTGLYAGTALAVWLHTDTASGKQLVYGDYFSLDAGWLGAGTIQTNTGLGANPTATARQLVVAGDNVGNAIVAWQSEQATADAGPPRILVSYLPAGSLGAVVALSNAAGISQLPRAAMAVDAYFNVSFGAVVWETQLAVPGPNHIYAASFDAARQNQFTPPPGVQLDTGSGGANPVVGVAANGNAIAMWQENGATAITSSFYTRGVDGGWSVPVTVESDTNSILYAPSIAVDPGGNAIASWLKDTDAGLQVRGGRYTVDGGWHDVGLLGGVSPDPVFNFPVTAVVDSLGRGFVFDTRNGTSLYLEYIAFQ